MKAIFGYRMHLWDITQFTPFKWNQKSQLLQPSVLLRFLLWTSNILHCSCYIVFSTYDLFRLVWVKSEVNRKEVAADFLFLFLATGLMFICFSVALSRSSHLKLVNSLFGVDEYLSRK